MPQKMVMKHTTGLTPPAPSYIITARSGAGSRSRGRTAPKKPGDRQHSKSQPNMLKLIKVSALLLLCTGCFTSCTALQDTLTNIISLPFNLLNSLAG